MEYLFELEEALKALFGGRKGVVDGHVRDVAGRVRALIAGEGGGKSGGREERGEYGYGEVENKDGDEECEK